MKLLFGFFFQIYKLIKIFYLTKIKFLSNKTKFQNMSLLNFSKLHFDKETGQTKRNKPKLPKAA
jgi:hypothetical protein